MFVKDYTRKQKRKRQKKKREKGNSCQKNLFLLMFFSLFFLFFFLLVLSIQHIKSLDSTFTSFRMSFLFSLFFFLLRILSTLSSCVAQFYVEKKKRAHWDCKLFRIKMTDSSTHCFSLLLSRLLLWSSRPSNRIDIARTRTRTDNFRLYLSFGQK